MSVRIKRVYDAPDAADGTRVLVDRLWPRGLTRVAARIDLWLKAVAPSDALRKRVHADPDGWSWFPDAYAAELASEEGRAGLAELRGLAAAGPVTLLFAAKDAERNNAVALKLILEA